MGGHPIDYPLLRRLVPRYHAPKGFDLGAAQERNLTLLALYLEPVLAQWGIDSPLRKAHFLGQCAEETTDFTTFYESTLDGKPVSGRSYEGRRDLGNTHPGDGAKFIGRGAIQTTGRANYAQATVDVDTFRNSKAAVASPSLLGTACRGYDSGFVSRPSKISEFPGVVDAACAYWIRHSLNFLADSDNVAAITRVINPGMLGFDKRRRNVEKARALLLEPSSAELSAALRSAGAPSALRG